MSQTSRNHYPGSAYFIVVMVGTVLGLLFTDVIKYCGIGVGAFAAPLVATQFAQLSRWSFIYLVTIGIAILNAFILIFIFRFRTQEG
jgi:hypothetical protein